MGIYEQNPQEPTLKTTLWSVNIVKSSNVSDRMDLKMHSSSPTLYFIDEKTKSILEMACPKSHV